MRLSVIKNFCLLSMAVLFPMVFNAWAEEESEGNGVTASANIGAFSKYIWRGYDLSDNIIVQPSLTLGYKDFSLNGWANVDTSPEKGEAWNETDTTISYETGVGPVTVGGGYIYYNLRDADDTKEVYLSVGYDTFLSPKLSVYKDIDASPGYYFNLGLSHSTKINEDISLDLSGGLGYYISHNDAIIDAATKKRYKGFQDGLITAGLTVPVSKSISISPSISYSFALSNKAKALLGDSGNAFGGVTLNYSF
jgi:hypothetical protein